MLSYCEYYGTTDTSSFEDFEGVLVLIFASAICYTLWRIFVTNRSGPRGGVVVLGLDDSSCVYSDLGVKGVSGYLRLLYFAVSILTFLIGVMTYEGLKFVSENIMVTGNTKAISSALLPIFLLRQISSA